MFFSKRGSKCKMIFRKGTRKWGNAENVICLAILGLISHQTFNFFNVFRALSKIQQTYLTFPAFRDPKVAKLGTCINKGRARQREREGEKQGERATEREREREGEKERRREKERQRGRERERETQRERQREIERERERGRREGMEME